MYNSGIGKNYKKDLEKKTQIIPFTEVEGERVNQIGFTWDYITRLVETSVPKIESICANYMKTETEWMEFLTPHYSITNTYIRWVTIFFVVPSRSMTYLFCQWLHLHDHVQWQTIKDGRKSKTFLNFCTRNQVWTFRDEKAAIKHLPPL